MNILEIAEGYVRQGLSVIPIKADGSKSPLVGGWRQFSCQLPDSPTLLKWFGGETVVGVGIVPGPASGNLVVLDFEHDGVTSAYHEWLGRLPAELRELTSILPTVITPSGGRHVYVRLPAPQPGTKIARYVSGKTKVEIRGEGHQVLAPGCPPECHRDRRLYQWEITGDFIELDVVTWTELVWNAGEINEHHVAEQSRDRGVVGGRTGVPQEEATPGTDFNARGTWEEAGLFDAGWTWAKSVEGDRGYLTRPGKTEGVSASVGMTNSKVGGYPYFYVWTTSSDFTADTPYSRFAVYTQLRHHGDFSAAARALRERGYGGVRTVEDNGVDISAFMKKLSIPASPVAPASCFASPTKWLSECAAADAEIDWIWKGYIRRCGITMISALWKIGKSTMLSGLLKAMDGSADSFIGQAVCPTRVLYVTEEDEKIWSTRRDELLIGDHVAVCVRPFTSKPTEAQWQALIDNLASDVERHRFDLVIFDTLSKMWPCEDENHAGQVEKALMPLWKLTRAGAAILLVHHVRKSGGEEFVGSRGSGGLPSFVEILMEFRRANPSGTQRLISAVGRYSDIPEKVTCDWVAGKYVLAEEKSGVEVNGVTIDLKKKSKETDAEPSGEPWFVTVLMEVLTNQGDLWAAYAEIGEAMAHRSAKTVRNQDLVAAMNVLIDDGVVERQGLGRKGSPMKFRLTMGDKE